IAEETVKWNGVDLVVIYHHPDLGALVVNPKNTRRIAQIDRLNRSELIVVYAGFFAKEGEVRLADAACAALIDLFAGRKPKVKPEFLKGDCAYRQAKAEKSAVAVAKAKPAPKAVGQAKRAPAKRGRPSAAAKAVEAVPVPEPEK